MFRSDTQLRILGEIHCSYTLSELSAAADTSAATAGREVELLRVNGTVDYAVWAVSVVRPGAMHSGRPAITRRGHEAAA